MGKKPIVNEQMYNEIIRLFRNGKKDEALKLAKKSSKGTKMKLIKEMSQYLPLLNPQNLKIKIN